MHMLRPASFLILLIGLVACAVLLPSEAIYLRSAQDQATQQQVRQRLGAPHAIVKGTDGQDVWVYEVRDLEPGAQSTWTAAGSWCDQYRLRFDQAGVLREWTHDAYRHGGENMPTSCATAAAAFLQKAEAVAEEIRRSDP